MTVALRSIAVAIALAALLDPALVVGRRAPLALEFIAGSTDRAPQIRQRLLAAMKGEVTIVPSGQGEAIVVVDGTVPAEAIRERVTVSIVAPPPGPNLRVARSRPAAHAIPGFEFRLPVEFEARGLAGRTSTVTAAIDGVEVGRVEHTWTSAARQRVAVPVVVLAPGRHTVRIAAAAFEDESRSEDNAIDVLVVAIDRPLRVAFLERRPSWTAGFLRRILETDPTFEIASVLTPSRGIEVRTSNAPSRVTPAALERFDLIVAGAPEELGDSELRALRTFMADRGGAVLLLPDRTPTGPYTRTIPVAGFDETLLERPARVAAASGGHAFRASELAIPRTRTQALTPLASLADGRPVVASWPIGAGLLMFSGALDAWRFRGDDDAALGSFWRSTLASAAMQAPPPIQVEVADDRGGGGTYDHVTVRVRSTEFVRDAAGSITWPVVSAAASDAPGASSPLRLWPTAEPGVLEGRMPASASGRRLVHVEAGSAQASVSATPSATPGVAADDDENARIAAATGGVAVPETELSRLIDHLRSVRPAETPATVRPMRSAWWTLPFAAVLCGEWALRRRRGER
jgi:hypothetical protein